MLSRVKRARYAYFIETSLLSASLVLLNRSGGSVAALNYERGEQKAKRRELPSAAARER